MVDDLYTIVTDILIYDTKQKKFLFCKKSNDHFYQLPGGHLKNGNDIIDSIKSYVKNQLNIDLEGKVEVISTMIFPNKRKIYYLCRYDVSNVIIDLDNSKYYSVYGWFDLTKVRVNNKLRFVLDNVLMNNVYSVYKGD